MKKKSKKQKNKAPQASTKKKSPKKELPSNSDSIMGFYLRAVVLAFGFFILFYYVIIYGYVDMIEAGKIAQRVKNGSQTSPEENLLLREAQSYQKGINYKWFHNHKWVYHQLLRKNLDIINQVDTFSLEQKRQYKGGMEYRYIQILKEKTPEDAVILMPDLEDFKVPENAEKGTPKFNMPIDEAWSTYHLYPRKLVYEARDSQDSLNGDLNIFKDPNYEEMRKKVTHVAIIYGRGYEHLEYSVTQREAYTALPIKKPSDNTNNQ